MSVVSVVGVGPYEDGVGLVPVLVDRVAVVVGPVVLDIGVPELELRQVEHDVYVSRRRSCRLPRACLSRDERVPGEDLGDRFPGDALPRELRLRDDLVERLLGLCEGDMETSRLGTLVSITMLPRGSGFESRDPSPSPRGLSMASGLTHDLDTKQDGV